MALARLAAACFVALLLAGPAQAMRGPTPVPSLRTAPAGLKGFLLRADETAGHTFVRTPSFAWTPVPGAVRYEFELSTSRAFTESSIVWSSADLTTPTASVPVSLPWITGDPYSLYAHVRAIMRKGVTPWSPPYGFNMRWPAVATPLPSPTGLLRWTTLEGANRYNVWLVDAGKVFTTMTNVADEREYYTFHQDSSWTGVVHWRVRGARWLYGATANGLPAISYGPWSPVYTTYNPPFALGPLTAMSAVSDTSSDALHPYAHRLMPGFAFSGSQSIWGYNTELYRVYAFTDSDCLNMVYRGAVVGSPAYAPRPTGPLDLPKDVLKLAEARRGYLKDGQEGPTFLADGMAVTTSEADTGSSGGASGGSGGGSGGSGSGTPGGTSGSGTSAPDSQIVKGAKVDLWDSDWPTSRYYWTVVPVVMLVLPDNTIEYHDAELAQEACASGRVLTFGKTSQPVVTGETTPYASGLSPRGRLTAAARSRPAFFGTPLVAWKPALGADEYEVQWSRTAYPWHSAGNKFTFATSETLPLSPGLWYYRVRGLNFTLPGPKPQMSWSAPVSLVVTKPRFRVIH